MNNPRRAICATSQHLRSGPPMSLPIECRTWAMAALAAALHATEVSELQLWLGVVLCSCAHAVRLSHHALLPSCSMPHQHRSLLHISSHRIAISWPSPSSQSSILIAISSPSHRHRMRPPACMAHIHGSRVWLACGQVRYGSHACIAARHERPPRVVASGTCQRHCASCRVSRL